jgi:geranylgeranyl pyrophosphate synthase
MKGKAFYFANLFYLSDYIVCSNYSARPGGSKFLKDNCGGKYNKRFEFDELKYRAYLKKAREEVSAEISTLGSKKNDLKLWEKISYALQTPGKLLRPMIVFLSGQSVGGRRKQLRKLALAIELLHDATLIHDDILDNDCFRRDMPTVHSKWGVGSAILVGDALASLSLNLSAAYSEKVSKLVSQACLSLCDGEYMDIVGQTSRFTEQDYFEKIRKKSATLFKVAAQCGAIVGGGSPSQIRSLAKFGENFGMAYQINDDILDITSLKDGVIPGRNDLQTLPFILLRELTGREGNSFDGMGPEKLFEILLQCFK